MRRYFKIVSEFLGNCYYLSEKSMKCFETSNIKKWSFGLVEINRVYRQLAVLLKLLYTQLARDMPLMLITWHAIRFSRFGRKKNYSSKLIVASTNSIKNCNSLLSLSCDNVTIYKLQSSCVYIAKNELLVILSRKKLPIP